MRKLADVALVLALIVAAAAAALAIRLSQGPIQLALLAPYVESALSHPDGAYRVRFGAASLAWDAEEGALRLHAEDVRITGEDQSERLRFPAMTLGLSVPRLLLGRFVPSSVGIDGARLNIVRRADDTFDLNLGSAPVAEDETGSVLDYLLAELRGEGAGRGLDRVTVSNAEIHVEDRSRTTSWIARGTRVTLLRDADGIAIQAHTDIEAGGLGGRVALTGQYSADAKTMRLDLAFAQLAPRLLALVEPQLGELNRIDLPVSGNLSLDFDNVLRPVGARLDLRGGAGLIFAREFYPDPVSVTGISLRARVFDGFTRVDLEEARIDIGDLSVRLSGNARRASGIVDLALDAEALGLKVNELASYWPREVAPNPRAWVTSNLRDGRIKSATLRLAGLGPTDALTEFAPTEIGGRIEFEGASVHYLRPMRPVAGVAGVAEYDHRRFRIRTQGGAIASTRIEQGMIELTNLDQADGQRAQIALKLAGPTREALELIDQQPLGFARQIGLKPATARGTQTTDLELDIPLLLDVKIADMTVSANSRLTAFSMPEVAFGHAVEDGDLRLAVDKTRLDLAGKVKIAGASLDVTLMRAFAASAPVQQKVTAAGVLDSAALARLGFDIAPHVTGNLRAQVEFEERSNATGAGRVALDLTQSKANLAWAGWQKPSGKPDSAQFSFETRAGKFMRLPAFAAEAEGLRVKGSARFRADGATSKLTELMLDSFAVGATDIKVKAVKGKSDWSIDMAGARLDLSAALFPADPAAPVAPSPELPPMSITIDANAPLGDVKISEQASVRLVSGTAFYHVGMWSPVLLEGKLGAGSINIQIDTGKTGRRTLIEADDAGAALGMIGLGDGMEGGLLKIVGSFDDADPAHPLDGRLAIADLRVTNAPTLAQLLTLASLTGIVNTLSGRGIEFSSIEVPFRLTDDAIEIKEGRVVGSELGISGTGRVDRQAGMIALRGEIAPAYTLNSLIGRIPLIGQLLTGGRDGLFAATYSIDGPVKEPKVSVNPLSVLAPGFARAIIEQIGKPTPFDAEFQPPPRREE